MKDSSLETREHAMERFLGMLDPPGECEHEGARCRTALDTFERAWFQELKSRADAK